MANKTQQSIKKEIKIKKAELKKLQEIYSNPSEIPREAKITFKRSSSILS